MANTKLNKKPNKQRLNSQKPLLTRSGQNRRWRSKSWQIKFGRQRFVKLSARRFRQARSQRSQKFSQIVLPLRVLGVREIVLAYKFSRSTKARASAKPKLLIVANVLVITGFAGALFFAIQLSGINRPAPPTPEPQTKAFASEKPSAFQLPSSKPTKLEVPSIGLSAGVQELGLQQDGSLETPGLFSGLVGWYKNSPTPGVLGPSILVGHVDNFKGPSVFWNLGRLKQGDQISITREDGQVAYFRVELVEQYGQADFPSQKVYGNIDHAGLRLITCAGDYNPLSGKYDQNLVVYASLQEPPVAVR